MNKKKRSAVAVLLTMTLFVTSTIFPAFRSGGGGRGSGGSGGGGRSMGGGGSRGIGGGGGRSMGGSPRGGASSGRSFSGAGRSGGARASSMSTGRGSQRNTTASRTTNVNVSGSSYGRTGLVAPVATAAVVGSTVAAGSAANSASSANRAAQSASQSATTANRAATTAGVSSREQGQFRGNRRGNLGQGGAGQQARPAAPATREAAARETQRAQRIPAQNSKQINTTVNRQKRMDSRRGNTSWNNRPSRFNVGGRRAYGFYNNGRYYATSFWGGIPYYWYNGYWTPWTNFWGLYPWWYDFYYSRNNNNLSFYDCDNNYDCPDGDCPPACQRYYD